MFTVQFMKLGGGHHMGIVVEITFKALYFFGSIMAVSGLHPMNLLNRGM
jgi:hypothetical protein